MLSLKSSSVKQLRSTRSARTTRRSNAPRAAADEAPVKAAPPANRVVPSAPMKEKPVWYNISYPEPGTTPYDDPTFEWAAKNSPWGNWAEMDQETKEKYAYQELLHARWAMLGTAGAWGAEAGTGIPWFQAGKVCTPSDCTIVNSIFPGQYAPLAPPGSGFPNFWLVLLSTLFLMGAAECYRMGVNEPVFKELEVGDPHPGGVHFDPLNLAAEADLPRMKMAELKNGRVAMMAWLGYMSQACTTNPGAYTEGLQYMDGAKGPFANWRDHIAAPELENVLTYV